MLYLLDLASGAVFVADPTDDEIIGTGGEGNDTISSTGDTNILSGGLRADSLTDGADDSVLHGDDTLRGDGGDDSLFAGAGNDELRFGTSNDLIFNFAANQVFAAPTLHFGQ